MPFTILYALLAALGLGLLIFIHEYGHYWMAKKEGMTVEVFSIGFGKPIYTWMRGNVCWQLCWIPFGGYVKIAGMEKKGALEPHQIAGGFYAKSPWSRIKVALSGPIVNIAFAFFIFCFLFAIGGRQKPFADYTSLIGSVEPESGLYAAGVRPGDQIVKINGKPFHQFQDFVYAAVLDRKAPVIEGEQIDYLQDSRLPFEYRIEYPPKASPVERIQAIFSMVRPASYLIYNAKASFSQKTPSPMRDSGIEEGDRILWVDGSLVFSRDELVRIINEPKALLTVKRGDALLVSRVPRVQIGDLRINGLQKSELSDWQHEARLAGKTQELFFIPYDLSAVGKVEGVVPYLNEKSIEQMPTSSSRSDVEIPLLKGDQIVAVDGIPVSSGYEIMQLLQTRHLQIIVKKAAPYTPALWNQADEAFFEGIDWEDLKSLIAMIGTEDKLQEKGDLKLLKPVEPLPMQALPLSSAKRVALTQQIEMQQKMIDSIKDPKQKEMAQALFDQEQHQLKLGIVMQDAKVVYNPSPFALFAQVIKETWKTLAALFTGSVTPKYLSGPVGIVHVMQQSWALGFKEAIFWLGMISLNLGILNLMPIPVLDGGHICFSLFEKITGKPLSSKAMERLIVPFIVLLIALFIYLTYNDLIRIFKGLF
ncbi:MAG: putative zinc metalloprotease [Chlamydiota bacterium]|jgi:regulator of sigma E protease